MTEKAIDSLAPGSRRTLQARIARAITWRMAGIRSRLGDRFPPFWPIVREVASVTGRSRAAVAADVLSTWRRRGMKPPEYAAFRLWEIPRSRRDEFLTSRDLDPFLVKRLAPEDRYFGRDKVECAEHARAHGVPWVPTLAVANRREGMRLASVPNVESRADLWPTIAKLIEHEDIVLKPANGLQGRGFFAVYRDGRVLDADGEPVARERMATKVFDYSRFGTAFGYVVQPLLRPHPEMVTLTGVESLATVRVVTLTQPAGISTLQSFLKIPAPGRLTDNFRRGISGTLIAAFDPRDGRLTDMLGVVRPGLHYVIERTPTHPRTGKYVVGVELPRWRECLDVAFRAASAHPNSPLFAWDIGFGPDGWVMIEANPLWGPTGGQVLRGEGLRPVLARLYPEDWA